MTPATAVPELVGKPAHRGLDHAVVTEPQEGGGDATATASYCQASEQGPAGVELDVCDGNASTASCTCYVDATPIGTCSVPMSQVLTDLPCFNTPCCNGLLGNVKG